MVPPKGWFFNKYLTPIESPWGGKLGPSNPKSIFWAPGDRLQKPAWVLSRLARPYARGAFWFILPQKKPQRIFRAPKVDVEWTAWVLSRLASPYAREAFWPPFPPKKSFAKF